MKKRLLFIIGWMVIFCSGCAFILETPSNLISPPAADQVQVQERRLINSFLSSDEHIEIPIEMENPAPSVDIDLDGDGQMEKLIFWVKNNGYQTGLTLLRQTKEGKWQLVDQKSQSGMQVRYFKAFDVNNNGKTELFVGVDIGGYNTLYVYQMEKNELTLLDQINYSQFIFADVDKDNKVELISTLTDSSVDVATSDLNVYVWDDAGTMHRISHQNFDGSAQEIDFGAVTADQHGLYVALTTDFSRMNILLLQFDGTRFNERMHIQTAYVNSMSARQGGIIRDINGDGILDVLTVRAPVDASKREPGEFLQIWRDWNGDDAMLPAYGIIENKTDGFDLVLPTPWLDEIHYQYVTEQGNSQLKLYDGAGNISGEPAAIIYARSGSGDVDLSAIEEEYSILGTSLSNQRLYLAKLYGARMAGKAFTIDEIRQGFNVKGGQ